MCGSSSQDLVAPQAHADQDLISRKTALGRINFIVVH
jgi:hypothetical protein